MHLVDRGLCLAVFGVLLLGIPAGSARAQAPADQAYMLLFNRFGELCTMCEATVACAAGDQAPGDVGALATGPYTLYHFQTKTFWGQVATIFKYLQRWITPVVREERPVVIYAVGRDGPGGAGRSRVEAVAGLSTEPALLVAGDRRIDRWTSAWQTMAGDTVGSCARVPLRETLAFLKSHAPWPTPGP